MLHGHVFTITSMTANIFGSSLCVGRCCKCLTNTDIFCSHHNSIIRWELSLSPFYRLKQKKKKPEAQRCTVKGRART